MNVTMNFGESNFAWKVSEEPACNLELSRDENCSANQLMKILTGHSFDLVPERYSKMTECFVSSSCFAPLMFPKHVLKEKLQTVETDLSQLMKDDENATYVSRWSKINRFLNSMKKAKIDVDSLRSIIDVQGAEHSKSAMSFIPDEFGMANRVVYNTSDSLTGRIKVISGPQVLTVSHDVRKCIRSIHEDGQILMVDFKSIEPRIALITVGKDAPEDVYGDALEEFPELNRQAAKLATLIALYGGQVNRLCEVVENVEVARKSVSFVRSHFRVENLERMLESQAAKGVVRNVVGRPLREATKNPRIRVNHFLQSSAAEISVLLFEELCSKFEKSVRPLFVIHDALIVDVPANEIENFIIAAKSLKWQDVKMPVKIEKLSPN